MAQASHRPEPSRLQQADHADDTDRINTNFDNGNGTRWERQLMRQRGAGSRQVENIDFGFGFSFGTPTSPVSRRSRTRSRTPTTTIRQYSTVRTPVIVEDNTHANREVTASIRSVHTIQIPTAEERRAEDAPSDLPRRKRRRLSEISNMTATTTVDHRLDTVHEGDVMDKETTIAVTSSHTKPQHLPSSPLFFTSTTQDLSGLDKENGPASAKPSRPAPKKKKRKSIGQQSKKKRTSSTPREHLPTPSDTLEESLESREDSVHGQNKSRSPDRSVGTEATLLAPSFVHSGVSDATPVTIAQNGQSTRRKRRKAIVQGKTRRKPSNNRSSLPPYVVESVEYDILEHAEDASDHEDVADFAPVRGSISRSQSTSEVNTLGRPELDGGSYEPEQRKRHASTLTEDLRRRDSDRSQSADEGEDAYSPDEATPEVTPVPKRAKNKQQQPKQKPHWSRSSTSSGAVVRQPKSTIPIVTYRMANVHTLPTITEQCEEDEPKHDSDVDELTLSAPPAITTRTAPNAVDVLAQACRETIDTMISTLKQSTTGSISKSELGKRLAAAHSFRSNLDHQLFQTSQSLDQRLSVEARVRTSRREKAELQAKWLEIRRRRDQLDLRKDAIRRQHWENESLSSKRFEASEAAFGVEESLPRSLKHEDLGSGSGLEYTLIEVAKDVSNASNDGNGSILQTLRAFNARLEDLTTRLG